MMKIYCITLLILLTAPQAMLAAPADNKYDEITANAELKEGFFNYYLDESKGKVFLEIEEWNKEFLYAIFLAAGVGSNDIGLDRGQIGGSKVVRFERYGPKVLLIQTNYDFRAESSNPDEQISVKEAFAESVLGGFEMAAEKEGKVLIDLSDFIIRDAHGVTNRLKQSRQGSYSLDKSRSAISTENTKNFPLNSEFEAILTFKGNPEGSYIRQVTPTANSVTVRQRHSFVKLPDDNYKKREFDPRSGYNSLQYMDFATPIEQDVVKRFIPRHRLEKKDPGKKKSEAIEPIIYYLDRGAPEPIRSALIEGASWWNEAFEAAGFKNAFRVEVLPEGADPLDIRFNVIQWVHRSTRGWSYGSSIRDPRTGEIIKGHVSLGSLRVRQDYLIAQGLLAPFAKSNSNTDELTEMALARLRQLSAHEVGHTLGLVHNYIASSYDRGSVMDYPHPLILLDKNGDIDLSRAYDTGIGEWDKVAIRYGYSQFSKNTDEKEALNKILMDGIKDGIILLSDQDARPFGSAHPRAHLWDNGQDATEELTRVMKVRAKVLENFSEENIPVGEPMARLEDVLVPMYLLHRYQLEATVKVIGGLEYNYSIRGDRTYSTSLVNPDLQQKALDAVLQTISAQQLALSESIIALIPPVPRGYRRGRENFRSRSGLTFDPLAAAETASNMTLKLLLNRQRCARLIEYNARDERQPGLWDVLDQAHLFIKNDKAEGDLEQEIKIINMHNFVDGLISLSNDKAASINVRQEVWNYLLHLEEVYKDTDQHYLLSKISKYLASPNQIEPTAPLTPPDGSPIGMEDEWIRSKILQCTNTH